MNINAKQNTMYLEEKLTCVNNADCGDSCLLC